MLLNEPSLSGITSMKSLLLLAEKHFAFHQRRPRQPELRKQATFIYRTHTSNTLSVPLSRPGEFIFLTNKYTRLISN